MNLNIDFFTPEQFFLKKNEVDTFKMPAFEPSILLNKDIDLFQPGFYLSKFFA